MPAFLCHILVIKSRGEMISSGISTLTRPASPFSRRPSCRSSERLLRKWNLRSSPLSVQRSSTSRQVSHPSARIRRDRASLDHWPTE
ncbi:hypothetical protein TELCIR_20546 [Teladorsagia circumcincta]|uniref:Uncharacterized protein n=1 Tax=Teladorsagia circumcincta TaxID=45464 RepID=A0A2G9TJ73_TELCI|nr:hypothetical protein TELCIR_20546 [Teladorsagia circumcincta]